MTSFALQGESRLLLVFCAFALAAPVFSAENPPEDGSLDEVVVRDSSRLAEPSQDQAASAVVLTAADYDDAGDTLAQTLDQQAGVRALSMGGPAGFASLSLRGSTAEQALVVIDGVPLNESGGVPVDLSRLPVSALDRVEVYRGMAPFVVGGGAIGGAVLLTTRRLRVPGVVVAAGGGGYGGREARAWGGGPLGGGSLTLGLDYSGAVSNFRYRNDRGTRFDSRDDAWEHRANSAHDQISGLGSWDGAAGPLRLRIVQWCFWRDQGVPGSGQVQALHTRLRVLDELTVVEAAAPRLAEDRLDLSATFGMRVSWQHLADPLGELGRGVADARRHILTPSSQAQATLRLTPLWRLSLRGAYRYEGQTTDGTDTGPAVARHREDAGLRTEVAISPAQLLLSAEGHLIAAQSSASSAVGADVLDGSFRVSAVNRTVTGLRLFVAGGRGVRLPSLLELFGDTGGLRGAPGLRPEQAWSIDAGMVWDGGDLLPDPYRFRLEVYGFCSFVRDLIQFVETPQGVAVAENLDRARLAGLEASLTTDLWRRLRLEAQYGFLHTRNTGDLAARSGKHLPLRPAHTFHLRLETYTTNLPGTQEASIYLEGDWQDGNWLDNANLVWTDRRWTLGVGAALTLPGRRARFSLAARNLTNVASSDLLGYPLPGLLVMSTAEVRLW